MEADPADTAPRKRKRRWYRVTPNRIVTGLVVAQCVLWPAEAFEWLGKGWSAFIAVAIGGAVAIVMFVWFIGSLIFRWRFQFRLLSLLVLMVAVAVPCEWLAAEISLARRQSEAVKAITNLNGTVWYDCRFNADGNPTAGANRHRDDWLSDLFGADFVARADVVWLTGRNVTDAELECLSRLPELRVLYLWDTHVTGPGLAHLTGLTKLDRLHLEGTKVSDASLDHVVRLARLRVLNLDGAGITDAGLEQLAGLDRLEVLRLDDNEITDDGLERLARLARLRFLGMNNTKISDAGLIRLEALKRLEVLCLYATKVTDEGVRRFRRALPSCQVRN